MITLLKAEHMKARRRYIGLSALAITLFGLVFALYGSYEGDAALFFRQNGYRLYLYQLPIVYSIFLPVMCMVVASRLADLEHKGQEMKMLRCMSRSGAIFDAKLIYGLAIVSACTILFWAIVPVWAKLFQGVEGPLPWREGLCQLCFVLICTAVVYTLQHSISLLVKNQAVALGIGSLGCFYGLFALYIQSAALRRILPWGYYAALAFMGLFGWSKETRYSEAWLENMGYDYLSLVLLLVMGLAIYLLGRSLFMRREY